MLGVRQARTTIAAKTTTPVDPRAFMAAVRSSAVPSSAAPSVLAPIIARPMYTAARQAAAMMPAPEVLRTIRPVELIPRERSVWMMTMPNTVAARTSMVRYP